MKNFPINIYCELLCLAIAVYVLITTPKKFALTCTAYLAAVVVLESIVYVRYNNLQPVRIYNSILNLLSLVFYSSTFGYFFLNKKVTKIVLAVVLLYVAIWLVDLLYLNGVNNFRVIIWLLPSFLLIPLCLYCFSIYLQADSLEKLNYYKAGFLIVVGVFLFSIICVIAVLCAKKIQEHRVFVSGILLHQFILRFMCMPLYFFISIALLKWKNYQQRITLL